MKEQKRSTVIYIVSYASEMSVHGVTWCHMVSHVCHMCVTCVSHGVTWCHMVSHVCHLVSHVCHMCDIQVSTKYV